MVFEPNQRIKVKFYILNKIVFHLNLLSIVQYLVMFHDVDGVFL